ncbi:MAG: BREX-1 system adenine-specific DNA-methyltransferase PglX, partial [Armatimonadetes bacterium]|nr:BREX-1 system adenine-specific DNA-methyltransferase PglX [Armatimonadota bacterium]
ESRPYDEEVAVDPEMLGKVYESLIAEEERGEAGIFYTPRLEVDMMCRLSVVEYLHQRWNFDRERLLRFVFSPYDPAHLKLFSDPEKRAMERALKECKVVDPAVGSGSFLVGMLNVLCELLDALAEALERKRYDRFELKRQLILNNLYGVDVKDWAVRACELRLFLSLLVDLPDDEMLKKTEKAEPILPNLDFRVRVGDSIVQEIPELPLPIILRKTTFLPPIRNKLMQLTKEKVELAKSPTTHLARKEQKIWAEERKIIAEFLESANRQVKFSIQQKQRELQSASPSQRRKLQSELEQLWELAEQTIPKQKKKLQKGEPIPLFLWEVAFPEVFLNSNGDEQGFDIVIMNPPYVRQEKIAPPTPLSPQDYKNAIRRNIDELWDKTVEVPGRADLYVPFFFVGTSLLKPKGILCLVTSNSWLDVDYGKAVQKFLLSKTRWIMTIDNLSKRTFAQSDINTVITLAVRPRSDESVWDNEVRFVAFKVPFGDLSPELFAVAFEEIFEAKERIQKPDYRVTPKTQRELFLEGVEEPEEDEQTQKTIEGVGDLSQLKYVGNKIGGKYLRAPDIFFTILEKGKGKLVRLGDIAEVRRGFTTGANEFFYLQPIGMTVKEVMELAEKNPKAPVKVKNGAGWVGEIEAAWLKPVIKSPREITRLVVRLEDLSNLIFMTPKDVRDFLHAIVKELQFKYGYADSTEVRKSLRNYIEQNYPRASNYIRWGESQGYPRRPTCASRKFWWDLGEQEQQDILILRFRDQRNWTPVLGASAFVSDVTFVGRYHNRPMKQVLNALLNCTLHILASEVLGRINLGEGLLTTYGPDLMDFFTVDASCFDDAQINRILSSFYCLSQRPIRSIFEELGFKLCRRSRCDHPEHPYEFVQPETLTLEQVKEASPDRFELDSVVFDVLGLTEEERLQVYRAVAELVKMRLVKAKSVSN